MTLPELSVRRRVLAYMMSAVLVVFGLVSYIQMGVDRFPRIEFPVVSVTTTLTGANPEVVDSSITNIIERAVNSVPGIDHVESSSSPGASVVNVTFDLDKDIDVAFNEIQAEVNQVLNQLPEDADPPVVAKVETDAQPVMWLSLQGDRTLQQLQTYARNTIQPRLETIDGVGRVRLGGRRDRTIRVNLDPERMAALGVTTQDLIQAFDREHFQLPGGFLVGGPLEDLLKVDLEYHNVDEIPGMVIDHRGGAPVHLRDVAEVEDGLADMRRLARFNREQSAGLGIVKIAGTNTVQIIDAVKERVDNEIRPNLPPGMTIQVATDQSEFIMNMVHALQEHIILATLFTALVVWVFLKNLRSTLIIALAIPVSLLGAAAVMFFADYTFNSITLLALLLLIGIVVDDAIVVLENIYRHRESIEPDPVKGAISGTNQVVFAILATTLTLVAIFAPVIFMGGIIGRFFESFAVVVTLGVVVSWFVAMTLTPALCARFLQVKKEHGIVYRVLDKAFRLLENGYRALLRAALRHRWAVIVATLAVVSSSAWFFENIGKTFTPETDESAFLISFRTPLGSSIHYTDERLQKIEEILEPLDSVTGFFAAIGIGDGEQVNRGIVFVRMKPRDQRNISQQELMDEVGGKLAQIPGLRAFASSPSIIQGQRGEPLQFVVRGPDINEVARLSEELRDRLTEVSGMGRLDLDLQLDLPQLELEVDRVRTADLGLSTREVAQAANVLAGGLDVARYNDEPGDGQRYDIRLKAQDGVFNEPQDLHRIFLRSRTGDMVRLDAVAEYKERMGPAVINRYDLQYAANFYGTPTLPLADAVGEIERTADEIMPVGYDVQFTGQADEFERTVGYVTFVFVLATLLAYMVLASQFNSFVQPFVIMMAQPLAMIGGLVSLWALGYTLNIYSMIGLILLIGLVAKNSILLVDLTNQLRAQGRSVNDALQEACPIRLRPVLMTSITLILALTPAALGTGAGSDTNAPLAAAVIGGMISSTLLTLVVVPVLYSLIEIPLERRRGTSTAEPEGSPA